ncbi:YebC/PmpR family DNA-binding transcriptional regulator [Flavobacteriaceae bacterium]|nr:YebC/PmpR family DNA-binding transcriptional regulator [Flavobacteriaceae bacterium]
MAGHSKFSNIKHRKGAQDAKRAKIFTKLQREIVVAAKSSPDPDFNPRLRTAIIAARAQNMPKDRIEGAIKKADSNAEDNNFDEMRYEAYGPNGTAFIVEALTDNKNRTAGEVRSTLTKNGGNMANAGAVTFMFENLGLVEYQNSITSEEEIFEFAIENGADDITTENDSYQIYSSVKNFINVRDVLIEKYGDPSMSKIIWKAKDIIELDEEQLEKIIALVDKLEDLDDVQNVFFNFDIPNQELD